MRDEDPIRDEIADLAEEYAGGRWKDERPETVTTGELEQILAELEEAVLETYAGGGCDRDFMLGVLSACGGIRYDLSMDGEEDGFDFDDDGAVNIPIDN